MAQTTKSAAKPEEVTINIEPFITPFFIFLSVLVFSASFAFGMHRVGEGLENYASNGIPAENIARDSDTGDTQPNPTPNPSPTPSVAVTSIDDDAGRGDRDAQVAIVEFSDFNCGFCQRFHSDGTYQQIVENFVDTGDAYMVYRDYPGVGGEFTRAAANAAECVREQTDDATYFEVVSAIYNADAGTSAKDATTVRTIAEERGDVDMAALDSCIADETFASEVDGDLIDGQSAGVGGTPSFIVGTLNGDGTVEGELVVGAQPYAEFERVIQSYL